MARSSERTRLLRAAYTSHALAAMYLRHVEDLAAGCPWWLPLRRRRLDADAAQARDELDALRAEIARLADQERALVALRARATQVPA